MAQTVPIRVYVCPTPGCGNYFGASGMPDLTTAMTGVRTENRHEYEQAHGTKWRHNRAECPDCRANGKEVQRKLVQVNVTC